MGQEGIRDGASREGDQSPEKPIGLLPRAVTHAAGRCPRMQRTMLAAGIAVFAASVAGLAVMEVASPGQRSMLDLQIYRWAGLVVTHSGDLYGSHFPHYHLFFTYTPMAGLVFAALSAIPMMALKWLVTAGSVASLAGTLWLTWGMLGCRRSPGRLGMTLTAAGVALWLLPVQQTLGLGQVNLMLMLIIVADLCQPDTAWTKGVGVGLAAGFKLTPLIFIPYLALTRRFRAAGLSLAVFGLTIAGSLIVLPRQARQFWYGGLFLIPGRTGNTAYVGNQSLNGALVRLLGSAPTARPYWLGISVAICAVGLLFAAWTARRGQEMTGILICALTGLLVSPISWSHHWVWMAPALVVAADAAIRLGTPVRPSGQGARQCGSPAGAAGRSGSGGLAGPALWR